MALRNRQTKAEAARHSEILKGLLRQSDNKICADCKRNDPRWASTNLGVFLCIRCSGVHRGMGVHISRVRSVDLDTWTPEQIEHIQKWGNRRANLYWEAHLKQGHQPPDHKVESFIRSKYESKRWALEGPLPTDPSTLDPSVTTSAPSAPSPATSPLPQQRTTSPRPAGQSSGGISLLDAPPSSGSRPASVAQPAPPPPQPASGGLFDLDFTTPATPAVQPQSSKNDILSLFGSSAAPAPSQLAQPMLNQWAPMGGGGAMSSSFGTVATSDPWGSFSAASTAGPVRGSSAQSGGFGGFNPIGVPHSNFQQPATQQNFGGLSNPPPINNGDLFSSTSVWGAAPTSNTNNFGATQPQKQSDSFGDIWGDFK